MGRGMELAVHVGGSGAVHFPRPRRRRGRSSRQTERPRTPIDQFTRAASVLLANLRSRCPGGLLLRGNGGGPRRLRLQSGDPSAGSLGLGAPDAKAIERSVGDGLRPKPRTRVHTPGYLPPTRGRLGAADARRSSRRKPLGLSGARWGGSGRLGGGEGDGGRVVVREGAIPTHANATRALAATSGKTCHASNRFGRGSPCFSTRHVYLR